jgi:hypothetical protein
MRLRFFRPFANLSEQEAEPTPSEAFVQERFGDAIAFVRVEWEKFDAQFACDGSTSFSLAQRIAAFMSRPLAAGLDARFPEIAALGAEADALTEMRGNTRAIFILIVGEAIIAAGDATRSNVRTALPD